jgi:hypothetical protein
MIRNSSDTLEVSCTGADCQRMLGVPEKITLTRYSQSSSASRALLVGLRPELTVLTTSSSLIVPVLLAVALLCLWYSLSLFFLSAAADSSWFLVAGGTTTVVMPGVECFK